MPPGRQVVEDQERRGHLQRQRDGFDLALMEPDDISAGAQRKRGGNLDPIRQSRESSRDLLRHRRWDADLLKEIAKKFEAVQFAEPVVIESWWLPNWLKTTSKQPQFR